MRLILQDFFLLDAVGSEEIRYFIDLVELMVVVLKFPLKGVTVENG